MSTWTIAYRKPTANRFVRADDFAGTWAQAEELAGRFLEAHPELQVFFVPTKATEDANPGHEDNGNILSSTGRRVRIVEGGTIGDLEPLTEYEARQEFEWNCAVFVGERETECPAKYRAKHGLPFVADPANPTDDELAAAIERGIASGQIIDADEFLARVREDAEQAPVTEVAPNVVVIRPDALGDFLAAVNANAPAVEDIDRAHTVTHSNGITQVFATPQRDRGAGESSIGAYQREGASYRTYAPDGSSLGVWATEVGAYNAIVRH